MGNMALSTGIEAEVQMSVEETMEVMTQTLSGYRVQMMGIRKVSRANLVRECAKYSRWVIESRTYLECGTTERRWATVQDLGYFYGKQQAILDEAVRRGYKMVKFHIDVANSP